MGGRLGDETDTTVEDNSVNFAIKSKAKFLAFVLHSHSQRVVPRPAISASFEKLWKIQVLRPHPIFTKFKTTVIMKSEVFLMNLMHIDIPLV